MRDLEDFIPILLMLVVVLLLVDVFVATGGAEALWKFLYDFQTLIGALLATAGVALTIRHQTKLAEKRFEREERIVRESIVTSVYWDLRHLQLKTDEIGDFFPDPSDVQLSDEAPLESQAELLALLEALPQLPNIAYHLPRIGQIGDLAPLLLKVLEEYEILKGEADLDVWEANGSLTWAGVFALIRRAHVVGAVAQHMRSEFAQRYPYLGLSEVR